MLGKPVIVPVRAANGTVSWKAIFGNGYDSASGKAVLFVVDIGTSSTPVVRMIEATEPGNAISGRNGLGNIIVLDRVDNLTVDPSGVPARTRDGYADTVYAADLRGAIWKFDLTSTAASVTVPAFTTGTYTEGGRTYRQPITGGLQAASGENGGVLVLFGTGSFSFNDDSLPSSAQHTQSLYGFTDQVDGVIATTLSRANLTPIRSRLLRAARRAACKQVLLRQQLLDGMWICPPASDSWVIRSLSREFSSCPHMRRSLQVAAAAPMA